MNELCASAGSDIRRIQERRDLSIHKFNQFQSLTNDHRNQNYRRRRMTSNNSESCLPLFFDARNWERCLESTFHVSKISSASSSSFVSSGSSELQDGSRRS